MKKFKKLFLSFILMFVCVIGLTYNVRAEDITVDDIELEEYSIDVKVEEMASDRSEVNLYLKGIPENNPEGASYFVKFVNQGDSKPVLDGDSVLNHERGSTVGYFNSVSASVTDFSKLRLSNEWYMLKGYTQAYVVKCLNVSRVCKVTDQPINVPKPELKSLENRYQMYLFEKNETHEYNNVSIFSKLPYDTYSQTEFIGDPEMNIKIGKINDNSIIQSIAKNETGAYERLLEYAKTAQGKVYEFENHSSKNSNINIDDFDVINGAYYYMYVYYADSKNLYRDLSGVVVAMGKYDRLVNEVTYDIQETLWDKFVEKYKQSEMVKEYNAEETTVEISHTDSSLKVIYNDGEKEWTTNFKHENGILTYEPSNNEESMIIESEWVANAVSVLADLYKYDNQKLMSFLQKNDDNKYTIAKEGIEFKIIIIEQKKGNEDIGDSGSINEAFSSFRMDLKGLKMSDEGTKEETKKEETTVKNPSTGLGSYGILALIVLVGAASYLLIRKQSKFPKHN